MPSQVLSSVENNFTKGLVTEFTGLNFPENAATDCDNCLFTLVGDINRRQGIDFELNWTGTGPSSIANQAIATYIWNTPGGLGTSRLLVKQVGGTVYFYDIANSTVTTPLSGHLLGSTVDLSQFVANLGSLDITKECQFADGNGYLFIFHPNCDPIYVVYSGGIATGIRITLNIRDFIGVPEALPFDKRPNSTTSEHSYNLTNQGWISTPPWSATSTTPVQVGTGVKVFAVAAGLTITPGDAVAIYNTDPNYFPWYGANSAMGGTVASYAGTTLTINVTTAGPNSFTISSWYIVPYAISGSLTTFVANTGVFPSNSDVWWRFKNYAPASTVADYGKFDPQNTLNQISIGGPAPKGHFVLQAFNMDRAAVSGFSIAGVTTVSRPKTGAWFQGRVWYTGVDASLPAVSNIGAYSWSENIYFSQIVQGTEDFGQCYQENDPTSEQLYDLLPTDGGIINIQGAGTIQKLFPIANGLLVFATNGVWFITGSQGIGFTANDYTITKISSIRALSPYSFVDVQGLPYFWNEEGIYQVTQATNGSITVGPITVGTILSFYDDIPLASKIYARAAYDPIEYVIQWIYRSDQETDVTSRYRFNRILNFNTYNKAFYPYTISNGTSQQFINSIQFVQYPSITATTPEPSFKYACSYISGPVFVHTFADEHDTNYVDWRILSGTGVSYDSYFITGYKLHGQGQRCFQVPYIYVFSRTDTQTAYKVQGVWDYASDPNSGRWSTPQLVLNVLSYFGMRARRHRIRGKGLVLQIRISSVDGQPFDIMGWSTYETMNTGV